MAKILAALGFLGVLLGLGASDALLVEGFPTREADAVPADAPPDGGDEPGMVLPPNAVRKVSGVPVRETVLARGYELQPTSELSIIRTVVPQEEAHVETFVLLREGDRAGLIAWTESPRVKHYFLALKETLHTSFSHEVRDLLDETQRMPGKPTRNLLTFFDPGISTERLVFIRVRERLYEFRVAPDRDEALFELIEVLTQ